MKTKIILPFLSILFLILSACQAFPTAATQSSSALPVVLASESFIGDIAQNVAGDRLKVEVLLPVGTDPHSFEPAPADIAKIAQSNVLIINGAGLETWLQKTLDNAGGTHQVIQASDGLSSRKAQSGELITPGAVGEAVDPHFWLDPTKVITYVDNIRDGLIKADPAGKSTYTQNAATYIASLNTLDQWVTGQVSQIPAARRLLVTNHDNLGYYADRYGFKIIGTIIPSLSSDSSPSAQELASLIQQIKTTKTPAVFLDIGVNPQMADQIASETGIKVVSDLYTETLSAAGGKAPDYLTMIRYDTTLIVNALKE